MAGGTSGISNGVVANRLGPSRPGRPCVRPHLPWCVLLGSCWLLFPPPTYAYIDPGTGSYMVQVVIAGLLGVLVSLRIYWARIKAFFKGNPPLGGNDPDKHE